VRPAGLDEAPDPVVADVVVCVVSTPDPLRGRSRSVVASE
jgi:hypothetical protein